MRHQREVARVFAQRMVEAYSLPDVQARIGVRGIAATLPIKEQRQALVGAIAEERFLLESAQLPLLPRARLVALAKVLQLPYQEENDAHLAGLIAIALVRDQVKYRVQLHPPQLHLD